MLFNIKQMEDKRIFQTSNMKDMKKDGDKESCTFEHTLLLTYISYGRWVAYRLNPARRAALSSSQECLEVHLYLLLLASLSRVLGSSVGPYGSLR